MEKPPENSLLKKKNVSLSSKPGVSGPIILILNNDLDSLLEVVLRQKLASANCMMYVCSYSPYRPAASILHQEKVATASW